MGDEAGRVDAFAQRKVHWNARESQTKRNMAVDVLHLSHGEPACLANS
jgi:hypothetical protein